MTTNMKIHEKAVEQVACNLIENGISTRNGPGKGVDLILEDDSTILVRGMTEEISLALTHGSLSMLKSDYIVVVTNLAYRYGRKMYTMTTSKAKSMAINAGNKSDGGDNWFVPVPDYRNYSNNHGILTE